MAARGSSAEKANKIATPLTIRKIVTKKADFMLSILLIRHLRDEVLGILGLDPRGVNLISDARAFCRRWYREPDATEYAKFRSRSHRPVIRVYEARWQLIETHGHAGELKEW